MINRAHTKPSKTHSAGPAPLRTDARTYRIVISVPGRGLGPPNQPQMEGSTDWSPDRQVEVGDHFCQQPKPPGLLCRSCERVRLLLSGLAPDARRPPPAAGGCVEILTRSSRGLSSGREARLIPKILYPSLKTFCSKRPVPAPVKTKSLMTPRGSGRYTTAPHRGGAPLPRIKIIRS